MADPNEPMDQQEPQMQDDTEAAGVSDSPSGGASGEALLQAAREEAAQYKDKYLRGLAEMDNFRKRQERLAADRTERAKRDLLVKILDVIDNLDRAMRFEETMDRAALAQTLRMMQWQLNEVLKNEGLAAVATVGEPFDPRLHEAVESVASDEHPEGTVVDEVRKGYTIGTDLLRPARVTVSDGSNA
ncbi:MAG: Heat shock protein GrpE [Ktedonobacterales bacterium]|jgi:molecular chaperone GrpE|nr:MAG: Heat shock protein GrpE [Ktedonobacterales bacterium]